MKLSWKRMIVLAAYLLSGPALAQIEVYDDDSGSQTKPATGKKAATEYFLKRKQQQKKEERRNSPRNFRALSRDVASGEDRFLTLSIGMFFDDESYAWGDRNQGDVADFTAGVTYRIGEWVKSMDLNFRADITSYSLREGDALKLSLLPVITFPDARSDFPLYFGGGAGIGVFFRQIDDESSLSLDYTVLAGVRLMELVEDMGFMAEIGMKNHILLLSDGQFNGAYFSVGSVFEF